MLAPWVVEEMKTADLNDERLNRRIEIILSHLAAQPTASIPAACGGYAETAAAYRFFDNDKVDFDGVLRPHQGATLVRIAAQPVVLLVPDTTAVDLTRPEQQVRGAGPLDGRGARRGVLLHLMHAFTPDGTPLGTVQALAWARDDDTAPAASRTRAERAAAPIEAKESYRWLLSMRRAHEVAADHPGTRLVSVADSEADIYDVLAEGMGPPAPADWIVRSCQDRALVDDLEERSVLETLRREAGRAPVLYRTTIEVRGREPKVTCEDRGRRQPRGSRRAVVEARAVTVTRRAPERPAGQPPEVTVNAVLVREVDPPAGGAPVEWLLLTSLPIATAEEVRSIVQYYAVRWMAEVLFRVLKSGCRVEGRRFEAAGRLLPCLAVYLIVAWRVLYVCRLGRSCPEISCEAIFEPAEWQSVYRVVRREPPPKRAPQLREMVRLVAQLGGYVNRSRDDEPGPQTLWLGLQRLHDIALCWQVFGPGATREEAAPGPRTRDKLT
jgi:hypothetical protein